MLLQWDGIQEPPPQKNSGKRRSPEKSLTSAVVGITTPGAEAPRPRAHSQKRSRWWGQVLKGKGGG